MALRLWRCANCVRRKAGRRSSNSEMGRAAIGSETGILQESIRQIIRRSALVELRVEQEVEEVVKEEGYLRGGRRVGALRLACVRREPVLQELVAQHAQRAGGLVVEEHEAADARGVGVARRRRLAQLLNHWSHLHGVHRYVTRRQPYILATLA